MSFGVRRRHFSGGAFVISIARLRSSSSTPYTRYNNKLNTTFEVHRLAFLTCLSPRFPVLQFGAAFSSLAFSVLPVGWWSAYVGKVCVWMRLSLPDIVEGTPLHVGLGDLQLANDDGVDDDEYDQREDVQDGRVEDVQVEDVVAG